jgi:hypothetical protein
MPKEMNSESDDEAFENAPLQFTADRLEELVRSAEDDPTKQVRVSMSTLNKIYMAYLGTLQVYRKHTAAKTLIEGKWYPCSLDLSDAIAPIMDEHRRIQAEKDVDEAIAQMKLEEAAAKSSKPPKKLH